MCIYYIFLRKLTRVREKIDHTYFRQPRRKASWFGDRVGMTVGRGRTHAPTPPNREALRLAPSISSKISVTVRTPKHSKFNFSIGYVIKV